MATMEAENKTLNALRLKVAAKVHGKKSR